MAAIIDGTTKSGYWKITPDDSSPLVYYAFPKICGLALKGVDADGFELMAAGGAYPSVSIAISLGNGVEDGNGNAFTTIDEILTYISLSR